MPGRPRSTKILGQAGTSLSDVYDVEGSIVGVEELEAEGVKTVHEMGSTLFSERFSGRVILLESGDIAQTTDFSINTLVNEVTRILGILVVVDTTARLLRASIEVISPPALDNTSCPIWVWDAVNDIEGTVSFLRAGAVQNVINLRSVDPHTTVPNILTGPDSPRQVSNVGLRGRTSTFGAGTVETTAVIYLGFPQQQGLSSHGLPVPSW